MPGKTGQANWPQASHSGEQIKINSRSGRSQLLFAEEITPELEQVYIDHQQQIDQQLGRIVDCGLASYLWGRVFRQHFPPAQIDYISGSYLGGIDPEVRQAVIRGSCPPGVTEHVWLEIEGRIFDPTAGQFSPIDNIFKRADYLEDQRKGIDQLIAEEEQELKNID